MSASFLNRIYFTETGTDQYLALYAPATTGSQAAFSYLLISAPNEPPKNGFPALNNVFDLLADPSAFTGAVFAFVPQAVADPELAAFAKTLNDVYVEQQAHPASFFVSWIDSPHDLSAQPPQTLEATLDSINGISVFKVQAGRPTVIAGPTNRQLQINWQAATESFLFNNAQNELTLSSYQATQTLALALNDGTATTNMLVATATQGAHSLNNYMSIPVAEVQGRGQVGVIGFPAKPTADFPQLEPGLQFSASCGDSQWRGSYPLLGDPKHWQQVDVDVSIDPGAPLDATRSQVRFKTGQQLESAYRTHLGFPISLAPDGGFLAFSMALENHLYLVPEGDFKTSVNRTTGTAGATAQFLLCGTSSTEYLAFEPATDTLSFKPGCAAHVDVTNSGKQTRFGALNTRATTSWISLRNTRARPYHSEPCGQAMFNAVPTAALLMSYSPVTQNVIPGTVTDILVPMAPYAGVAFADPSSDTGFMSFDRFESRVLSKLRSDILTDLCHSGVTSDTTSTDGYPILQDGAAFTGTLATPAGYLMTVAEGKASRITFAEAPDCKVQTTASGTAGVLPQPLLDAMFSSEQFLVFSLNKDGNFGTPVFDINLGGWSFEFSPPASQSVGDYQNVVIFKSATGKLVDWVASPEKWINYADFNDATADKEGNYLSTWLVDYCDTAIRAAAEGATEFANFAELVQDDDWTGFIALRVAIDIQDLDPDLYPLLGGINLNGFFAHHVGSIATRLDHQEDYSQDSSLFALVHYQDPSYTPGTRVPPYVRCDTQYDYKVLTLTALFLKSGIASFNCKLQLVINELFGATVSNAAPTGQAAQATNRLVLDGSVQSHDGVSVYTFATPEEANYFYLANSAITTVVIDKAEFAINRTHGDITVSPGLQITSAFTFWGSFAFNHGPPVSPGLAERFDVFSFDRLGFEKLGINLSFDVLQKSSNPPSYQTKHKQLTFDPGGMSLANRSLSVTPGNTDSTVNHIRSGSLLSQFPMKVRQFYTGTDTAGKTPEDFGYTPLKSAALDAAGLTGNALQGNWYALEMEFQLGSMGALAPNIVFTASMMLAWDDHGQWYTGLKLPGLGPLDKLIDIEGVIKFGAEAVRFDRVEVSMPTETASSLYVYSLLFASIGLHVLSLSFPPAGSTNVSVFGNPPSGDALPRSVGWFGSYAQPGLKPDPKPPIPPQG